MKWQSLLSIGLATWFASSGPFSSVDACTQQPETAQTEPEVDPRLESSVRAESEGAAKESVDPPVHSEATRIAELHESLEHDRLQLERLEAEIESPESEYAKSEKEFRALNEELQQAEGQLETARNSSDPQRITQWELEVASLHRKHKLSQDRFDLAIEDRKTLREQRATLRHKIENDKHALMLLTGEGADEDREYSLASALDTDKQKDGHEDRSKHREGEHDRVSAHHDADTQDEPKSHAVVKETDAELIQATADADAKEHEADLAQEETESIADRLSDIQRLVAQEQKELDLARKKVELATSAQLMLGQELSQREAEKADADELAQLRLSIQDANQRLVRARAEVAEISERLNDHRAEQSSLQAEHIVSLHEAEKKRHEAAEAEGRVESLRNPYTLRNMTQWLIEHAPRLFIIALGMLLLNRFASFFALRSVRLLTTGTGRGSTVERENRAQTLVGVFQNAATVAIFITGILMILEEVGANITVLMGGVAVIGLAVAFGAQNLIKDYFYGFVMLLENQYMLNDSVRIGGVTGQVERITLRMTVLRDSNGVVHFIPNGTINSVSNETHGWSRAVCEIAVGYQEDLGRITQVLKEISQELISDPSVGRLLIDAPTEPAIESLGESSIQMKIAVKTLPNKHGMVKQEWLRRIKNRFSQLGIEPPYQQRIVHVQPDSDQRKLENQFRRAS